jgi:hypothetical protein
LTEQEKLTISEAIARQLISGSEVDKALTSKLIKGLCEEYNEVRERGISGISKEAVGDV